MDHTDFLPLSTGEPGGVAGTFEDLVPHTGPVGGARQRVVDIAKSLRGTPFTFGGQDPDDGFDHATYVQYVFKQMGIHLPRISAAQAEAGKAVPLSETQPGDLVAWSNSPRNGGADHIAIYIGDNHIIEAPKPGMGVRVRELGENEGDAHGVSLDY